MLNKKERNKEVEQKPTPRARMTKNHLVRAIITLLSTLIPQSHTSIVPTIIKEHSTWSGVIYEDVIQYPNKEPKFIARAKNSKLLYFFDPLMPTDFNTTNPFHITGDLGHGLIKFLAPVVHANSKQIILGTSYAVLFDVDQKAVVKPFQGGHNNDVYAVCHIDDTNTFFIGGANKKVNQYDLVLSNPDPLHIYTPPVNTIRAIYYYKSQGSLIVFSSGSEISMLDFSSSLTPLGHTLTASGGIKHIQGLKWDDNYLMMSGWISGGGVDFVRFDKTTGFSLNITRTLCIGNEVMALDQIPEKKIVAVFCKQKRIKLFDMVQATEVEGLAHYRRMYSGVILKDSSLIVISGQVDSSGGYGVSVYDSAFYLPCHSSCKTCQDRTSGPLNCTSCNIGFFLNLDKSCQNSCQDFTVDSSSNPGVCEFCSTQTCPLCSSSLCSSCKIDSSFSADCPVLIKLSSPLSPEYVQDSEGGTTRMTIKVPLDYDLTQNELDYIGMQKLGVSIDDSGVNSIFEQAGSPIKSTSVKVSGNVNHLIYQFDKGSGGSFSENKVFGVQITLNGDLVIRRSNKGKPTLVLKQASMTVPGHYEAPEPPSETSPENTTSSSSTNSTTNQTGEGSEGSTNQTGSGNITHEANDVHHSDFSMRATESIEMAEPAVKVASPIVLTVSGFLLFNLVGLLFRFFQIVEVLINLSNANSKLGILMETLIQKVLMAIEVPLKLPEDLFIKDPQQSARAVFWRYRYKLTDYSGVPFVLCNETLFALAYITLWVLILVVGGCLKLAQKIEKSCYKTEARRPSAPEIRISRLPRPGDPDDEQEPKIDKILKEGDSLVVKIIEKTLGVIEEAKDFVLMFSYFDLQFIIFNELIHVDLAKISSVETPEAVSYALSFTIFLLGSYDTISYFRKAVSLCEDLGSHEKINGLKTRQQSVTDSIKGAFFFEDLNLKQEGSHFSKYFNLYTMVRFSLFQVIIVSMQLMPNLQTLFLLVIQLYFAFRFFRENCKKMIFENYGVYIKSAIFEVSVSVLLVILWIFSYEKVQGKQSEPFFHGLQIVAALLVFCCVLVEFFFIMAKAVGQGYTIIKSKGQTKPKLKIKDGMMMTPKIAMRRHSNLGVSRNRRNSRRKAKGSMTNAKNFAKTGNNSNKLQIKKSQNDGLSDSYLDSSAKSSMFASSRRGSFNLSSLKSDSFRIEPKKGRITIKRRASPQLLSSTTTPSALGRFMTRRKSKRSQFGRSEKGEEK